MTFNGKNKSSNATLFFCKIVHFMRVFHTYFKRIIKYTYLTMMTKYNNLCDNRLVLINFKKNYSFDNTFVYTSFNIKYTFSLMFVGGLSCSIQALVCLYVIFNEITYLSDMFI